ncbi:TlpA family protein disulfide reductase [Dyella telluris]|uniref:TlpA family protein disulfide reductase n=1 Tax=Dyella telluris TaxID=2763498 RepID=A0A7G8PZ72_9GAMM|nr:TlpA disulfide reductase family protein [Dyella telluris]QNJ99829.1 TlpA family protein disulfide reductase [Dyella telluris]
MTLLASSLQATPAQDDEQRFVATLQLGPSPDIHYLDANGKPLVYAAFAQQLGAGRDYSSTTDSKAGAAMLRLRPPGTTTGTGRFSFGRGSAFPPFELPSLQGGTVHTGDLRGRYTLVSFFFAECGPCIAEVPMLNAFAHANGDMGFLAITYQDADTARAFVNDRGFRWPVLHDGQALIDTLGVNVYPTLILVDPSGRVAGAAVGTTMRDGPDKQFADLTGWVQQWKKASQH